MRATSGPPSAACRSPALRPEAPAAIDCCSRSLTLAPFRASSRAIVQPAMPPPTIATSDMATGSELNVASCP